MEMLLEDFLYVVQRVYIFNYWAIVKGFSSHINEHTAVYVSPQMF